MGRLRRMCGFQGLGYKGGPSCSPAEDGVRQQAVRRQRRQAEQGVACCKVLLWMAMREGRFMLRRRLWLRLPPVEGGWCTGAFSTHQLN